MFILCKTIFIGLNISTLALCMRYMTMYSTLLFVEIERKNIIQKTH